LFTGFAFFLPLPVRGSSVHISSTFSSTMLQCQSNAFTRPEASCCYDRWSTPECYFLPIVYEQREGQCEFLRLKINWRGEPLSSATRQILTLTEGWPLRPMLKPRAVGPAGRSRSSPDNGQVDQTNGAVHW
jgi:hypothetical protein